VFPKTAYRPADGHRLAAETVGIRQEFAYRDGSGLRGCDRDHRRAEGQEGSIHHVASTFLNASHAALCTARQGVRSHPVPGALVGDQTARPVTKFVGRLHACVISGKDSAED